MSARLDDNRIVHGLWIGSELSRLEQLTLRSFTRFGHEFHLWVYDEITTPLPVGVSLRDANVIFPRERVFRRNALDPETGVGRNSLGAFSDLFRYKLLYERGGIWVDMDVTALRRFDFKEEYLFRPHRLGMVGNVMKCPKGSELMRAALEETEAVAGENIAFLEPVRILNKHVERLGLTGFIRPDISNEDHWLDAIRALAESNAPIPSHWYAIHWVNEFWRTLKDDNGQYRGRQVIDTVPDKDNPFVGSTLHELYRYYRLIDPWAKSDAPPARRLSAPPATATLEASFAHRQHLNVLVPTLVRGGAERMVVETVDALKARGDTTQNVSVATRTQQHYALSSDNGARVRFLSDEKEVDGIRRVGLETLSSPIPLLYTHLIRARELEKLWKMGVTTVPVVHNARPGWLDSPDAYNNPNVPFVIACADAVAAQLRESGCERPIITLRHEMQRWFSAEELATARRNIRDRHGIGDDTLLIGMVGEFKSQKAYTRAVRVLAQVRRFFKAKLMILGGWDHAYGSGRTTFEATMRQAVELGVVADVIVPGNVEPVDPYLGAFDVFLNTSVYEGLSISLLEAIQAGCPIVSANAGGNREVLPVNAVLVEDSSDIEAYVDGIVRVMNRPERILPPPPPDADLVPRLWALLARHGARSSVVHAAAPSGTLFVTQNLHVGGPSRAVVNLLTRMPADSKNALCVLGGISVQPFRDALARAQVPILALDHLPSLVDRAEQILVWADRLNVRNICFWNAQPEVKLLISKVLTARDIRLIDVSPGPMLFDELAGALEFQRRVSLSARSYVERLDDFVALYEKGTTEHVLASRAKRTHIIPRGVPLPPRFVPLPPADAMLPQRFDPDFAIGTCCRVVPDKRVEFLFEMMRILSHRLPQVSLTIVGGPDAKSLDYWEGLLHRVRDERLDNIRFVGRHDDVNPFLAQFKVFVMVSDRQGSPNASLEAMAMRLPVVANPDGGTSDQIADGINGFLADDPARMAAAVEALLRDPARRRAMGEAAFKTARERFGMAEMVRKYHALLDGESFAREPELM